MRRIALVICAAMLACGGGSSDAPGAPRAPDTPAPPPDTLVLYDDGGPWGWLGEVYAISAGHLASHFGTWAAMPVRAYVAGDMLGSRAVVYVGSTYDAALPEPFLDDVLSGLRPVLWAGDNVWALAGRDPGFPARGGLRIGFFDESSVREVRYKERSLARSADVAGGILECFVSPPATVLATAVREADGTTLPWAVRSGSLTYVAENPFTYVGDADRYFAFADLLFDALAPDAAERHRALVRLEDVSPVTSPDALREIADMLHGEGVPFAVAVIPVYVDPHGAENGGEPERISMRDAPEVADALRYMVSKGGVLVLHGYTHQLDRAPNPYSAVTGDDFEFWVAHVDEQDRVVYDTPVPGDSAEWAAGRVLLALEELRAAGLPRPAIFEYPHYAGSAVDSRAIAPIIPTAYHRGLYFPGLLQGTAPDVARLFGQTFPYDVVDVYGWRLLPENLGNYSPTPYNGVRPRLVADLVAGARAAWVVRDGFASFFFHPEFGADVLREIVDGVRAEGFTFVSPGEI